MPKKTQMQIYEQERERIASRNRMFIDMVNDPHNPLTNDDLVKLVAKFPERWGRFSGFIGNLP